MEKLFLKHIIKLEKNIRKSAFLRSIVLEICKIKFYSELKYLYHLNQYEYYALKQYEIA